MILHDAFTVEPWSLREIHLDLDLLPQTEPLAWDDLMHDAAYLRALERL